jgi:hypothetical protein
MSKPVRKVRPMKISEKKERKTYTREIDKDGFYPRLLIYKARKAGLWMYSISMLILFGTMMYRHLLLQSEHWTVLVVPIMFFGLLGLLLPPVEEWEYKPWQNKAQQYEHYFYD